MSLTTHHGRIIPAFLAILLVPILSLSQAVTQSWVERITGTFKAGPVMAADGSGNVYLAATINTYNPKANIMIYKYNSAGVLQWSTSFDGRTHNDDEVVAIALDGAGNVYVTGTSEDGTTNRAISTIKLNPAGTILWSTWTEPGTMGSECTAMAVDAAGNVWVTGDMLSSTTSFDFLTFKLDANGVQQWIAFYNGTGNEFDYAVAVKVDTSGNAYVTGPSAGTNHSYDFVTIKYSPSGAVLWTGRYDSPSSAGDMPRALALDASANVYVTGSSLHSSVTVAYSSSGTPLWTDLDTLATGNAAIAVDPSGNIVTAGYLVTASDFLYYYIKKRSPTGSMIWNAYYPAADEATPLSVALGIDYQGNCYFAGGIGTSPNPPSSFNYLVGKYSSSGALLWSKTYNGPSNLIDVPTALAVVNPKSGRGLISYPSVYVTGLADMSVPSDIGDLTTIKYTQSMTVGAMSAAQGEATDLAVGLKEANDAKLLNYPNPFRGSTNISYTLPFDSHVSLKVYDQAGKQLATLVEKDQPAGAYTLPFHSGRLAGGIYHYELVTLSANGSFRQTKQLLLVK